MMFIIFSSFYDLWFTIFKQTALDGSLFVIVILIKIFVLCDMRTLFGNESQKKAKKWTKH